MTELTPNIIDRFWSNVEKRGQDECWIWRGGKYKNYGRMRVGNGKRLWCHRISYELMIGKIPDGLVLDHLCRNPSCCNPHHLDPVTNSENVLRGEGAWVKNSRKTHCKRGHSLAEENLFHPKKGAVTWRVCRTCKQEFYRKYYYANKEKLEAKRLIRKKKKQLDTSVPTP